ncbi:MAG: CBS domain-containing protein [Myxococcales bacterium]|nr:CBS domain-containing protein [Myxococcales bacterium]
MNPLHWAVRVGRIARIDVKVHVTFVLVLALGAYQWGRHGVRGAMFGVVSMLLLFVCVTLHELGHGLVARSFQLPTDEIVLYPFGGAAKVDREPPRAIQELIIAGAGPIVNVAISAVLAVVTGARLEWQAMSGETLTRADLQEPSLNTLLVWLLSANVMMAVFNMIPVLPMDGGRVLRALLGLRMSTDRATQIAVVGGVLLGGGGLALGAIGGNVVLAVTAGVVVVGAVAEWPRESRRSPLHFLRAGDAYNKGAIVLAPDDPLDRVVHYILTSYQPDFAVVENGKLVGAVTRKDVLEALGDPQRVKPRVREVMRPDVHRIAADAALDDAYEEMKSARVSLSAVYDGDRYLGLVSQDDIAEARLVASYASRREESSLRGS